MRVHYDEGIANHIGPEPCAGIREDVGEASVGERAGQPLSHDRARRSLGVEEVRCDGNHPLESRGLDSLPGKANHRPKASLACECGNALLEA